MTRTDPIRLLNEVHAEMAWYLTIPHSVVNLRAAMLDQHPAHPKAQNLDGERHGSGISRPTERAALTPDRSAADLRQLQADLEYLDRMVTRWRNWRGYVTKAKRPGVQEAGEGPCPAGMCRTCWSYGKPEERSERYKNACRWCGDEAAKIGQRPPEAVWRLNQQGRRVTVADYRRLAPDVARRLVAVEVSA